MSKLVANLALINATKAIVNAYTWTTLPFYAIAQRPWQRLRLAKSFDIRRTIDRHGRTIYSRPRTECSQHPYYKYSTFPEAFKHLDRSRSVIGTRDVIAETIATNRHGQPIVIEGKPLKKLQLSDHFRWLTVGEVIDNVDAIARGLRSIGVRPGDKVLIYAENSVEWFYTSLALARLNAIMVTLFSTLGDQGVAYGINQSEAAFVVTSEDFLPKLNKLSSQFTHLKSIVFIRNQYNQNETEKIEQNENHNDQQVLREKKFQVIAFDTVRDIGEKIEKYDFPVPNPDDVAVIMYTSGTTGDPKGVIMRHRHLNSSIKDLLRIDEEMGGTAFKSQYPAYLPMAHLFGYLMNLASFCSDAKIAFCSPLTLLDSSPAHVAGQIGDMKLIQPELFIAVPLLLERILKDIYRRLHSQSIFGPEIFNYLMDYKIRWTTRGFDTPLINRFICKKLNQQFGGKLKWMAVSSAPLHERTHALVQAALNVQVLNAYGATETCGGSHMSHIDDLAYGTCGIPLSSAKFYLKDWEEGGYSAADRPNPRGEIILGGASIASGYYKMDDESRKAFRTDDDGTVWYSSGDIGEVLPNGTLKIIDRKKDLTKLANGEFVSLGKIESGLRTSKFVENICICTDPYSNHVTALISPNRRSVMELAVKIGKSEALSFEQLCADGDILRHVHKSIKQVCKQNGFKVREIPVEITLVHEEWSPDNNLLTAAFKLKRKQVTDFYANQIREMFARAEEKSQSKATIAWKVGAGEKSGGPVNEGINVS